MISTLKYVLDANVFITPARLYYSFDFGTKYWDFLVEKANERIICSIDKVLNEIMKGDEKDPLRKWAEHEFVSFFESTNNDGVLEQYKEIVNSVYNILQCTENAKNDFLQEENADPWVIAFAKLNNLIVVTEEKSNPQAKRKIFIPDVCKIHNVEFIETFQMLRDLNFKL